MIIESSAGDDITEAALWIAENSPDAALRWQKGLEDAVYSLETFPERCSTAPESDTFDYEIRHLIHGNYRILFTIRGRTVHILHVRHGARQVMTPDERDEADDVAE